VRIPKKRLPITVNPVEEHEEMTAEDEQRGVNMGSQAAVKFKILFHFIKR
jgi:hypothetical protein